MTRAMTPPGVRARCCSRSSCPLKVSLTDSMTCRNGLNRGAPGRSGDFPANNGYPELARAQIRYIGAGGSPKVSDPSTMKADHFTLSLVYLPAGNYAASHVHEVEEAFFVVQGVLTIASDYDGRIVRSPGWPRRRWTWPHRNPASTCSTLAAAAAPRSLSWRRASGRVGMCSAPTLRCTL